MSENLFFYFFFLDIENKENNIPIKDFCRGLIILSKGVGSLVVNRQSLKCEDRRVRGVHESRNSNQTKTPLLAVHMKHSGGNGRYLQPPFTFHNWSIPWISAC